MLMFKNNLINNVIYNAGIYSASIEPNLVYDIIKYISLDLEYL